MNINELSVGICRENFILLTDSYKLCHHAMYLDDVQNVYSYFESRRGAKYPYTVVVGLQTLLLRYFVGSVVTMTDVLAADIFCQGHFGENYFNRKMWEKIVTVHGGKLPLRIKCVPEGMAVPVGNVLVTVEATDEECAPLTNVIETLLTHIWHPMNIATISRYLYNYLESAFMKSAETLNLLPFMLHDFGFRGVSSVESAGMALGHLIKFMGTDTIPGITYAQRYYGAGMAGYSVAASEHSVMTSLGEDGEIDMVKRLIEKYPKGILSVVADSYNIIRFVDWVGGELKESILSRDGKFVIRPDSPRHKDDKACDQILWIVQELEKSYGVTINSKGFKVLHPKVGVIYGDGLSVEEIKESIDTLVKNGYSAESCVYGMGSGLLQKHNRDTQRNAFKCSAQLRHNVWFDIKKKPLDITKASKAGRLKLVWNEGAHGKTLITVPENDLREDVLVTVFENGEMVKLWSWDEVKANSMRFLLEEIYTQE